MATPLQLEFFRSLYAESMKTYENLEKRASAYIAITTLYIGAIAFKFDDTVKLLGQYHISKGIYLILVALFTFALLLILLAIRVRTFKYPADPEVIIRDFGPKPPTDEDFCDNRIIDYTVTTKHNNRQNERIARLLFFAASTIACALFVQFLLFVYIIGEMYG